MSTQCHNSTIPLAPTINYCTNKGGSLPNSYTECLKSQVHHRLLWMYQMRTTEPTPISVRGTKVHQNTLCIGVGSQWGGIAITWRKIITKAYLGAVFAIFFQVAIIKCSYHSPYIDSCMQTRKCLRYRNTAVFPAILGTEWPNFTHDRLPHSSVFN